MAKEGIMMIWMIYRRENPFLLSRGRGKRQRRGEGEEGISSGTSLARRQLSMELSLIEAHSHLADG